MTDRRRARPRSEAPAARVREQLPRLRGVERDIAHQSICMMIAARLARSHDYRIGLKRDGMAFARALETGTWLDR